jgi:hypothetical protein
MWLVARCASRRARAMSESSACAAASSDACAKMDQHAVYANHCSNYKAKSVLTTGSDGRADVAEAFAEQRHTWLMFMPRDLAESNSD